MMIDIQIDFPFTRTHSNPLPHWIQRVKRKSQVRTPREEYTSGYVAKHYPVQFR